jgi:hypothetical protein
MSALFLSETSLNCSPLTFEAHSFNASTIARLDEASPPIIMYVNCPAPNLLSQAQQTFIEGDVEKKLLLLLLVKGGK